MACKNEEIIPPFFVFLSQVILSLVAKERCCRGKISLWADFFSRLFLCWSAPLMTKTALSCVTGQRVALREKWLLCLVLLYVHQWRIVHGTHRHTLLQNGMVFWRRDVIDFVHFFVPIIVRESRNMIIYYFLITKQSQTWSHWQHFSGMYFHQQRLRKLTPNPVHRSSSGSQRFHCQRNHLSHGSFPGLHDVNRVDNWLTRVHVNN